MADVNQDDEQTLDQSNSGVSDDQTDDSVANNQDDDQGAQGDAGDDQDNGDGGSDDSSEGRKGRGEVRHERWINKLADEIRVGSDQNQRYTEEIFNPRPYQPLEYKPDTDYDTKDLEADRNAVRDNARAEGVRLGLSQFSDHESKEHFLNRLDIDTERVSQKWDALDPAKEAYNAKLEATMVQKYIAFTGVERQRNGAITIQKPNIRFRDFVDAEMQNMEDYAASRNANSSKNIVRQAAQTGVRPNGQARVSKGGHGFDANDPVGSVNRMSKKQYFELGGKEASDKYLAERGLG